MPVSAGGSREDGPGRAHIQPSLWMIVRAFGRIGLTSFGGGRVAYFWHEIVVRRRWLTETELLEGLAVSHVLPGPNIGNLSVYLGQRLRGGRGAVLALVAVVAPGAVMMLALTVLYFARGQTPAIAPVFRGVGAAAVGLAFGSAVGVGARTVRDPAAALLAVLTFAGVALAGLNPLAVIIPLALAGAVLRRPRERPPTAVPAGEEQ